MSQQNNLTDIWNVYKDNIIKEAKTSRPIEGGSKKMNTKPGKGAVDINSKDAQKIQNVDGQGTTEPVYEIDGLERPLDPKTTKKAAKKGNLYEPEKYSAEQFDKKLEKSYREGINNSMKSTFDKLFEEVMGPEDAELDALGIETDEGADDAAEGSDEVTITLDRDMAEKLCDLLNNACGHDDSDDAEEADAEDGEYEEYEEAEEDDDEDAEEVEEAVDAEDHGHALVNLKDSGLTKTGAGSNKVKTTAKVSGGKADGKVKKQDDGTGSAVTGDGGLTKTGSGSNKVKSSKTSKVGSSLFD